jgi:hypothetical protein
MTTLLYTRLTVKSKRDELQSFLANRTAGLIDLLRIKVQSLSVGLAPCETGLY